MARRFIMTWVQPEDSLGAGRTSSARGLHRGPSPAGSGLGWRRGRNPTGESRFCGPLAVLQSVRKPWRKHAAAWLRGASRLLYGRSQRRRTEPDITGS